MTMKETKQQFLTRKLREYEIASNYRPPNTSIDFAHEPIGRVLTRTEQLFFSWTRDEREAVALAKVCTLPANATYQQIETAAIRCFCSALEHAGLEDSVEYVGGRLINRWKEADKC